MHFFSKKPEKSLVKQPRAAVGKLDFNATKKTVAFNLTFAMPVRVAQAVHDNAARVVTFSIIRLNL